jgi:hypothetical protein
MVLKRQISWLTIVVSQCVVHHCLVKALRYFLSVALPHSIAASASAVLSKMTVLDIADRAQSTHCSTKQSTVYDTVVYCALKNHLADSPLTCPREIVRCRFVVGHRKKALHHK